MQNERARALTYAAIQQIKDVLDDAENPEEFFVGADAIIAESDNLLELPVDSGAADALTAGAPGAAGRDVSNGAMVYQHLGAMDRANASDIRLWIYLAFVTYRPYMEERWPPDAVTNWKARVEDRWLILNASRGSLVRHGISRLWWISDLTYDASCTYPLAMKAGNPFAYGEAVFQNEDRVLALFDREVGAISGLVRAVLEHAESSKEAGGDAQIRALMKEVTLVYGFRDIEILADTELRGLVAALSQA
jgi:hypothetical protein